MTGGWITYRGHQIRLADDGLYIVSKDNTTVSVQTTEEAALRWIDPLADETVREGVRKREQLKAAYATAKKED